MANRSSLSPRSMYLSAPPAPPPEVSRKTLSRSRTPEEAFADLYVGIGRTHAIRGVTDYAVETLGVLGRKRREVVEDVPEVAELADMLIVNATRLMGGVQNSLLGDTTQVIV